MEIVDANAGLLINAEVYSFLADPKRNDYPSFSEYERLVSRQRERDHAVSFLSATDAKKLIEQEEAEEALTKREDEMETEKKEQSNGDGSISSAAAASPSSTPAASSSSSSSSSFSSPPQPRERDFKSLEGTCWVKERVLSYLGGTAAASQTPEIVSNFLEQATALMATQAAAAAAQAQMGGGVDGAAAAGKVANDVRLTVCELLQLLNLRPTSLVEIHRAIEECEERLSEEDTLALLGLISTTLPPPPNQQQGQEPGEEDSKEQYMETDQ